MYSGAPLGIFFTGYKTIVVGDDDDGDDNDDNDDDHDGDDDDDDDGDDDEWAGLGAVKRASCLFPPCLRFSRQRTQCWKLFYCCCFLTPYLPVQILIPKNTVLFILCLYCFGF